MISLEMQRRYRCAGQKAKSKAALSAAEGTDDRTKCGTAENVVAVVCAPAFVDVVFADLSTSAGIWQGTVGVDAAPHKTTLILRRTREALWTVYPRTTSGNTLGG